MPVPMLVRRLVPAFATALAIFAPLASARAATGWQEWHQTGNDVFVTVDKAGTAHVEHRVRYRVVAGKMQSFDLPAIDMEAQIVPDVSIAAEDGARLGGHAEGISAKAVKDLPDADPSSQVVRVSVDDPKGLKRGTYTFVVAYDVEGWKTKHLTKDGSLVRITFKQPPSLEGRDGARAVFRLPPGPTEPRIAVKDDGTEGEQTALVTLRRSPEVDEIELLRAHVSRGEVVTWAVRADAKVFAANAPKEAELAAPHAVVVPADRKRNAIFASIALCLGLALGALFGRKTRAYTALVARLGATPRPLLPLPAWSRPPVFALSFAAGLAVVTLASPLGGATCLLVSMLVLVELRPAKKGFRVRGPGEWRPFPAAKAGPRERLSPWLDGTTARGTLVFAAFVGSAYGLGLLAERFLPGVSVVGPLAMLALAPLFYSGVAGQLPSTALGRTLEVLRPLSARIEKAGALRARLYGRVPKGEARWDEARLRALPKAAMPGVRGLEVGVVETRTLTGFLPTAEILVRVFDGSAAHLRLEGSREESLAGRQALPGREADEKVLRFAPSVSEPRDVEALLLALADELRDRRGVAKTRERRPYRGAERRSPARNAREAAPPLVV